MRGHRKRPIQLFLLFTLMSLFCLHYAFAAGVELDEAPVWGSRDAKVTVVEFTDFSCIFCGWVQPTLSALREKYHDTVRFAFKHLPFHSDENTLRAHLASTCAQEQGQFWEYRQLLFENQFKYQPSTLMEHARTLGLDLEMFRECMKEKRYSGRIVSDLQEARDLEISGTPTFIINRVRVSGAQPYRVFQAVIDRELQKAR